MIATNATSAVSEEPADHRDSLPDQDEPFEAPETAKAPPASRRSQEDRSRDAKERLLSATIDVMIRRGYNGLTTKEVAKTAGLSNGALMHHYSSKAELVVAATTAIYDECIARGQRIAHTAVAVKKPVEGFISDSLSVYFDWPFLVALEIIVVARTDAELMKRITPVMNHYRQTTNVLWLEVFKKAGYSPKQARTILNISLNMSRGMAVNRTWQHDDTYYQALIKEWIKIVEQQFPVKDKARKAGGAAIRNVP